MTPLLQSLLLLPLVAALPQQRDADPSKSDIQWRACPEVKELIDASNGVEGAPFDCATLQVPLDYAEEKGEKLDLSLFRVNATKQPILGTVLFNPGGPGGTGGENLPIQGSDIVEILGGQYHVVSWDPRGTGKTLPFDCNHTQLTSTLTKRNDATESLPQTNVTNYFLTEGWDASVTYADACYEHNKDSGRLIGTAYTARDMLAIVDALNEGGQLRYWGLSYGTALGNYFASMFPDRIERMLLDGNMNPWEYTAGTYGAYPQDADATLHAFFEECLANAANCSLATSTNASTPAEIMTAINSNANLSLSALSTAAATDTLSYMTFAFTKNYIFSQLYYPFLWPRLADTITTVMAGGIPDFLLPPPSNATAPPKYSALAPNAIDGIRCSDALSSGKTDPYDFVDNVEEQALTSPSFGDTGFIHTWACAAWKLDAKERLPVDAFGPGIKTSHPILFVNGLFDPATPAASAVNASQGYEGSKVLLHRGYGHGLMSDPSECVNGYVERYFMEGVLPDGETNSEGGVGEICEPDLGPWELAAKMGLGSKGGSQDVEEAAGVSATARREIKRAVERL